MSSDIAGSSQLRRSGFSSHASNPSTTPPPVRVPSLSLSICTGGAGGEEQLVVSSEDGHGHRSVRARKNKQSALRSRARKKAYTQELEKEVQGLLEDNLKLKRQCKQATRWGDANVVDAEWWLLANALLDFDNECFVLVSESCIPLYPLPVVHAYLTRSRHSFIGAFDDPSPHGRGRYRAGLAPDVTLSQWHKGAQWFEMDRHLAVFVIADDRYYPRFRTECRALCYVDEHYLPTVLSIEAPTQIANRTITRGGAHPATFGAADVTDDFLGRLVGKKGSVEKCMYNGQPVEVCFLFARKLRT